MKLKPLTVADIAALAACYREIDAAAADFAEALSSLDVATAKR